MVYRLNPYNHESRIHLLSFLIMCLSVNACKKADIQDSPSVLNDHNNLSLEQINLPTLVINIVFSEYVSPDLEGAKEVGGFKEFSL